MPGNIKNEALETKFSFSALKGLLYAALLTPLWVWSIFLFPFITSKILYFRLVVEIALLFYVILAVQYPEIRPRWNWLNRAVWIYFLVILLTSIFGVDFGTSFMGSIERGEGVITVLHFAIYFTILSGTLTTRQEWYKYLFFAVTVTLATAFYGLAQLLNLSFVIHAGATRISGTIGNASFFAAFMLFGMFLSLYLARQASSTVQRWYLYLVFAFEAVVLFLSQTRGALLGAAVAFLLYFLFNIFKSGRLRVKAASAVLLVALVSSGILIYTNRNAAWIQKNHTIYRLATISINDITTQSRLDTWGASWKGAQDRLFVGYGYENYNIAFNKYFPARIFKDAGSQIWFDRAHNIVFDVLVTSGIFGLLSYFSIYLAAFWILWRLGRKADYDWQQSVILGVLLVSYLIQNLFVFDTQATYLMIYLVLALIVSLERQHLVASPVAPATSYPPGFVMPVILTAVLLFAAYFINIEPAFANYYATQGIKYGKMKQYREIKKLFEKSLSYGTYMDREIRQRLVDYANEAVASGQLTPDEQKELYGYTLNENKKSLVESPRDVKNYLYVMSILNRFAGNQGAIQEIYATGEKALKLSPTRPQIYTELGQAAFTEKNFEKGLEYFRQAVELNPEPKESHYNYMLAGIISKRDDIALKEFKTLTEDLKYTMTVSDFSGIARAYLQAGDKQKAVEAFKIALTLNPKNEEIHIKLAATYGEICDKINAKATIDKLVELNPDYSVEGFKFLNELETKCP